MQSYSIEEILRQAVQTIHKETSSWGCPRVVVRSRPADGVCSLATRVPGCMSRGAGQRQREEEEWEKVKLCYWKFNTANGYLTTKLLFETAQ